MKNTNIIFNSINTLSRNTLARNTLSRNTLSRNTILQNSIIRIDPINNFHYNFFITPVTYGIEETYGIHYSHIQQNEFNNTIRNVVTFRMQNLHELHYLFD